MIRPFTCICMLLAAGSGLYLYQTKHRAQLLDREIARTYKQIDTTRDRITALKGEWAGLSETERLADLVQQHLVLKALDPKQFAAMADLGARLPAPAAPGTPAPSLLSTEMPPAETPAAAPVVVAKATPAAQPRPAPAQLAATQPTAPQPPAVAAAQPPKPAPLRPAAPVIAVSAPATATPPVTHAVAHTAPQPGASAPGIGESVARAALAAQSVQAQLIQPQAIQASTSMQPAQPMQARPVATAMAANMAPPAIGSALGGVRSVALPAPVPFGTTR